MKLCENPEKTSWAALCERPSSTPNRELVSRVDEIVERVKRDGDQALFRLSEEIDRAKLESLRVSQEELQAASQQISKELKEAIDIARANIELFHSNQRQDFSSVSPVSGVKCWQETRPIKSVGLYIPGGTAPYPSTVLMLGVPACVAGVPRKVLFTPAGKAGIPSSVILYCASLLGIDEVYRVGGAQAIAAMAYGTESIAPVDKIFGPGNQYVTQAKRKVAQETNVAIDMPAGPTELAILASADCNPEFVAADILAQAEHGRDSQVLLVSDSRDFLRGCETEVYKQLQTLPRKEIAEEALRESRLICFSTLGEGMKFLNGYAPEHLILAGEDAEVLATEVFSAGSVFIGEYCPEAAGDYASGTNHTLPTAGAARAYSGISLSSFQKTISFQEISPAGLSELGPTIETLARAEEFEGHARSASFRLRALQKGVQNG